MHLHLLCQNVVFISIVKKSIKCAELVPMSSEIKHQSWCKYLVKLSDNFKNLFQFFLVGEEFWFATCGKK